MRLRSYLPAAVVVVCAADCTDATAPDTSLAPLAGTYTLRAVGGAPLPFGVSSSDHSLTSLVADTLILRADSTFARVGLAVTTFDNVYVGSTYSERTSAGGAWSRRGAEVTLRYASGTSVGRAAPGGASRADTLVVTQGTDARGAPLTWTYAR